MNEDCEKVSLLNVRKEDGNSITSVDDGNEYTTDEKDILHPMGSFIVMFGFSLGSGILLMSYTVRQLGVIPWLFAILIIILLQFMATYMINLCTIRMIEQRGCSALRDPYQSTAELAGGRILRQFSVFLMYITNFIIAVSLFLISASNMVTFIPIGDLAHAHNIRVWVVILIVVLTPLTFLGTYSDLKVPSIIAMTTALISAIGLVVNCILKIYIYPDRIKEVPMVQESQFSTLGTLIFLTAGASITVSNLTVLTPAPRKLLIPTTACYILMFIVYIIVGFVPYFTFHGNVMSSVLQSMSDVKVDDGDSSMSVFRGVTMLIQVLMLIHLTMASILAMNPILLLLEDTLNVPKTGSFVLIHLTMASILAMNPILLLLEDTLNVPKNFNWKRVVSRSVVMLLAAAICVAMPEFEVIINLAGGVPLALLGIILPIFFYTRIFEIHLGTKICLYGVMGVILVFVAGTIVESVKKMVK